MKARKTVSNVTNIAQHYADLLEQYENDAYDGHFGADWLEQVGEGVRFYALECAVNGKIPTFKGLMYHIQRLNISANKYEESIGGRQ